MIIFITIFAINSGKTGTLGLVYLKLGYYISCSEYFKIMRKLIIYRMILTESFVCVII